MRPLSEQTWRYLNDMIIEIFELPSIEDYDCVMEIFKKYTKLDGQIMLLLFRGFCQYSLKIGNIQNILLTDRTDFEKLDLIEEICRKPLYGQPHDKIVH